MLKLVTMNTTELDPESNAALVSCFDGGEKEEDREPYGALPMMCDLMTIAIPVPPDADGKAEALVAEGVGGANGRAVGAWDTRLAEMAGELGPGDGMVCAPHPNKAVRVLHKGEGRAWAVVIDDADGNQAVLTLAGKEGFAINVHGHQIGVNKQGIAMSSRNGANGISITDAQVHIKGTVLLGGMVPIPGQTLATSTMVGWATTPTPGPLLPVLGVFVGLAVMLFCGTLF